MTFLVLAAQWRELPSLPTPVGVGLRQLVAVGRIRSIQLAWLVTALAAAGHFTAYIYLEPFLSKLVGVGAGGLSAMLLGYGVAGFVGTFICERAASRHLFTTSTGAILFVAATVACAALLSGHPAILAVCVFGWGAALGAIPVCVQLWSYQAAPDQFEASSALTVTVFQIAVAGGAFAGGVAADAQSVSAAFGVAAIQSVIAAVVLLTFRPRGLDGA